MRPLGSPEELARRRLRAVRRVIDDEKSAAAVAREMGVNAGTVRRWARAFRAEGDAGLAAKPTPGRPPRLDAKQLRRLERLLLKGAKEAGFPTELWTCPRIAALIERDFGVSYHVDHIGRLLQGMGWSPQKPQKKAVERDEAEIQRWVKVEWPRIKKKPARRTRRSRS